MCCAECHDLLKRLIACQVESQRMLMEAQRRSIPMYLSQARQYQDNATSLNMNYHTQAQTLIRVTTIIAVTTSAGTLQIAERLWAVTGVTILQLGIDGMLIRPNDVIQISQTAAGLLGLEFFGTELADRGDRW